MSNPNKLYYKTCREQAGLTQEQAIVLLGISEVGTLSKYENGHLPVNSALAAEMAKVYKVPSLAIWHLKYASPELARYLPKVSTLVTDGDMALQMELADEVLSGGEVTYQKLKEGGEVTMLPSFAKEDYGEFLKQTKKMEIPVAAIRESGKENTLSVFFNVKDKEAVNSIVQGIVREKMKAPEHNHRMITIEKEHV
ncbi:MAG: helix-turn-helix transcriptional regulator, partial [Oscillospiraceae bacterium]|nr:helix-turn-helix transcriptional regulator [Oscillospiraceae bacterium]